MDHVRYTSAQRGTHWTVVGLLAMQFLTGDGMARAFGTVAEGTGSYPGTAWVHGIIGSCILVAMLYRAALRYSYGAPPPPDTETETLQKVSRGTHMAFYVLLIAMPLAGLLAVFTGSGVVAEIHAWTSTLLLILIIAHIAGAIWHATKHDGVVARMVGGTSKG